VVDAVPEKCESEWVSELPAAEALDLEGRDSETTVLVVRVQAGERPQGVAFLIIAQTNSASAKGEHELLVISRVEPLPNSR
jgi:hypothetical protein